MLQFIRRKTSRNWKFIRQIIILKLSGGKKVSWEKLKTDFIAFLIAREYCKQACYILEGRFCVFS